MSVMRQNSAFSYRCGRCGLCCHNKVITLSPYDVLRIARAASMSMRDVVARFTIRRGSILRFDRDGCVFLRGAQCSIHQGRPLACRLYPLGIEGRPGDERFVRLEPAPGSAGIYGEEQTVAEFLEGQEVEPYLSILAKYERLIEVFRMRIVEVADFEKSEPRRFRARAMREALAESNFEPNDLIDAFFDFEPPSDYVSDYDLIERHIAGLREEIMRESDAEKVAAAAVFLAVSLGHDPREVFTEIS
jgi:Fe-S-cluster containining protein